MPMVTGDPVASTSFFSLLRSSGVTVTFSSCFGFSPFDVQNVLRSRALPPNRSAGEPSDSNCSPRLDSAGSSRGSARSVGSNETPMLFAVRPGPVRSVVAVMVAASPVTGSANDCSKSVGVGDWLAEEDESSASVHEHPAKRRASVRPAPRMFLLIFTAITLPCSPGFDNFDSGDLKIDRPTGAGRLSASPPAAPADPKPSHHRGGDNA